MLISVHSVTLPQQLFATVVPSVSDEFCAMPVPEVAEVAVKFDGAHYHDMYIANVR